MPVWQFVTEGSGDIGCGVVHLIKPPGIPWQVLVCARTAVHTSTSMAPIPNLFIAPPTTARNADTAYYVRFLGLSAWIPTPTVDRTATKAAAFRCPLRPLWIFKHFHNSCQLRPVVGTGKS